MLFAGAFGCAATLTAVFGSVTVRVGFSSELIVVVGWLMFAAILCCVVFAILTCLLVASMFGLVTVVGLGGAVMVVLFACDGVTVEFDTAVCCSALLTVLFLDCAVVVMFLCPEVLVEGITPVLDCVVLRVVFC